MTNINQPTELAQKILDISHLQLGTEEEEYYPLVQEIFNEGLTEEVGRQIKSILAEQGDYVFDSIEDDQVLKELTYSEFGLWGFDIQRDRAMSFLETGQDLDETRAWGSIGEGFLEPLDLSSKSKQILVAGTTIAALGVCFLIPPSAMFIKAAGLVLTLGGAIYTLDSVYELNFQATTPSEANQDYREIGLGFHVILSGLLTFVPSLATKAPSVGQQIKTILSNPVKTLSSLPQKFNNLMVTAMEAEHMARRAAFKLTPESLQAAFHSMHIEMEIEPVIDSLSPQTLEILELPGKILYPTRRETNSDETSSPDYEKESD